jgi:hypothetical protein
MKINQALTKSNLSMEQLAERLLELRDLDESQEKLDRAMELMKWMMGVLVDVSPKVRSDFVYELGFTAGEVAAIENLKLNHDATAKAGLGVVAKARQSGEDIYKAVVAWRQSPAGWQAIDKRKEAKTFLGDTAFSYYIDSELDSQVRAELVARLEMYCKSGWADADLNGSSNTQAAKRLLKVVERLQSKSKPVVTPEEASTAVGDRFAELFVDLKVVSSCEDNNSAKVFVATISNGTSGFDAVGKKNKKGSVAGSGYVDIAIRVHGQEHRVMVASVTKGNPFGTQASSFLTHASAIQAGIRASLIPGVESVVEFSRYVNPTFYTDEDAIRPINRKTLEGMDGKLKSAGNLVTALADLHCPINHPLFTPELFLRAPINVFGASDPWEGALDQARALAFGDSAEANRLLVRAGLTAARDVMNHLSKNQLVSPGDEIGASAAKAAIGLLKTFGDLPGMDKEITSLAEACIQLKEASRNIGQKTFDILGTTFLCELSVERAKRTAEDFRPTKSSVSKANRSQEALAEKKRKALPNRLDMPGVSEARLLKAQFGRQVAELVEALPLSLPNLFPEGVADKLASTFRRLAQVADGTMPTIDPNTGNNEKTYQQCADFLRMVKNGSKEIGATGTLLIKDYLPWVKLNQPDSFNPAKSEPPSVAMIEQLARSSLETKKGLPRNRKPIRS